MFLIIILLSFTISSQSIELIDSVFELIGDSPNENILEWNITFNLFKQKDPNKQIVFDLRTNDSTIISSDFDPKLRTKFILHGWQGDLYAESPWDRFWMMDIKDYILGEIDANVICVDWSVPAGSNNYVAVLPNVVKTGKIVAYFIKRLINITKTSINDIHCIGHSLGAHVCGHTGKSLHPEKMAQISGLDPAWPGFDRNFPFAMEEYYEPLGRTDANLVLVVHTSGGIYSNYSGEFNLFGFVGHPNPLGHYDFRINGGNVQPMCKEIKHTLGAVESLLTHDINRTVEDIWETVLCPHSTSYVYPIAKQNNTCQMIAYLCKNYEDFEGGKCADIGLPLEFNLDFYDNPNKKLNETNVTNNMFIKTSDSYPHCLFHYQIVVETESNIKGKSVDLNLFGDFDDKITVKLNLKKNEQNIYHALYTDRRDIGYINEVNYNPSSVKIKRIYVNYMSHIDERIRKEKSSRPKLTKDKFSGTWIEWVVDLLGK